MILLSCSLTKIFAARTFILRFNFFPVIIRMLLLQFICSSLRIKIECSEDNYSFQLSFREILAEESYVGSDELNLN